MRPYDDREKEIIRKVMEITEREADNLAVGFKGTPEHSRSWDACFHHRMETSLCEMGIRKPRKFFEERARARKGA